jgi:hypothetical protein
MAHYAFLDSNNIVTNVIPGVDEWEQIEGKTPEEWYGEFVGQPCKRTSYNTYGNQRADGGVPYRLNYAGVGYEYRQDLDGFIPPQPFSSWLLDESTGLWQPPTPYPEGDGMYAWDEELQAWVEVDEL